MHAIDSDDDYLIFSLDIEKAFDSVWWEFLNDVLKKLSIAESFIKWINLVNVKKELRLFNNGHSSGPIRVSNGLPQGDSLSLLLFILCLEALASTIRNNPLIEGIKYNDMENKISLVADNT